MSEPLSERERRVSQRATVVMACLMVLSGGIMGTNGPFGVYLKQLEVSGEQLGRLMAWTAPFGIAGVLCAGLMARIGRKRMMGWMLIPTGLFIVALMMLTKVKVYWGPTVMLAAAWALLAAGRLSGSMMGVPWWPIIQMITLPARRGAFLGRMRMFWALTSVIALMAIARLVGPRADIYLIMILIGLAGGLYWLMILPLHWIVERRSHTRPTPVRWAEAWRAMRASPLYVRGVAVDVLLWFGVSMFDVFQLYFLTNSLGWSDSAAIDMLWITMLGLAVSSIFWGTVADRLGDRAITQVGFLGLAASALFLVIAGNDSTLAKIMVTAGAFGLGVFRAGAMMGTTRVLLNDIPERVSPVLLALWNTWQILAMTAAAALGSVILQYLNGWQWFWSEDWLVLGPYKVLFLISVVIWLNTVRLCRKFSGVPGRTPWAVLAAMFNRPFQIVWMISRIDAALPERGRLNMVRRLAQTSSPLASESLTASSRDASYDVRLAAVNALASRADPESSQVLMKLLDEPELDIQPEAAWALGEVGDRRAVPVLMTALDSVTELLRGRAARALGKLNAHQAVPILQRILTEDPASFVRRSAAIALSRLNNQGSMGLIFGQFRIAKTRLAQRELALALANLVHGGDLYYRIRRHETQGMATVVAEAMDESLSGKLGNRQVCQCFLNMLEVLRKGDDLRQVRVLAGEAVHEGLLPRPIGNAGELTDYLLGISSTEPWAEEHAALLIFLLLQGLKRAQRP